MKRCVRMFLLAAATGLTLVQAAEEVSETPQVQTYCGGAPIKRFGFCWVLGEAPTLLDSGSLQEGNRAPLAKVTPLDSARIGKNYLGVTTTRLPRTTGSDYLPLEAIHLIDGNLETCWMSRGQTTPDAQPIWIRLDFPVEHTIRRVALRTRPPSSQARSTLGWGPVAGAGEVGRGLPATVSLKASRDSRAWETLYDGPATAETGIADVEIHFDGRPVKQLLITAGRLPKVENILYAFSLAEVEVYDDRGENVALASRGAGITVNSTHHSPGQELAAHRWYWPLHYDAGFKWARVGYHDDAINWHWVEREKGVLRVDPVADAAITELASHGVNIVMSLNFGNRLYSGPATRAIPQLWEWNYDMPAPPTTPEALAAWTRYVAFMAEHFRGRVKHFEIWNEWNISCYWGAEPKVSAYLAVARAAIPAIRQHAPEANIMMGSWSGFPHGIGDWQAADRAEREKQFNFLQATRELAREVDEIGWHPFYQTDPDKLMNYAKDVRALRHWLKEAGFQGHCMATEWNYSALYPPLSAADASQAWCGSFRATEMEKAKYIAQVFARHTGLGVEAFFCEMYFPQFGVLDLSLLRRSFDADPIPPLQPQAAYYVTRNLATMLDGWEPGEFEFTVEPAPKNLEAFPLVSTKGRALALWRGGHAQDRCESVPVNLRLPFTCAQAVAYDPIDGVRQQLNVTADSGGAMIPGVRLRDSPLILQFEK
jgi:hypothetical protein